MTNDDNKLVAIISYGTLLGWIIAIILHQQQPSELGGFHLRQSLGLYITAVVLGWIPLIGTPIVMVLFVFWVLGLVEAVRGRQRALPVIGGWYQQLLGSIK